MLGKFLFGKHLEEDESVIRIVHKHWFLGLKGLFWPSVFFAAGAVLMAVHPAKGVVIVLSLAEVIVAVWWLRSFLDHYLDAWIITDHGIIDVAWHGWFHRESARVLYSDGKVDTPDRTVTPRRVSATQQPLNMVFSHQLLFGTSVINELRVGYTNTDSRFAHATANGMKADEFGFKAVENVVHVHDLHATILHLLGFDHERLTYRYAGRDFRLTDVHGRVVRELLA